MTDDSEDLSVAIDRTSEHEGERIDTAGMMLRVKERLRRHEGWVNHMYLDTKGNVTVGVGFLLNRSDVRWYPWISRTTRRTVPARVAEANWDTLKAFAPYGTGYGAARFLDYATVELTNAAIGFALAKKLAKLRDNVIENFQDVNIEFDQLPVAVQEAMFDMGWNLGAGFIKGDWPKLRAALKARNWKVAAEESHRKASQVSELRNTEIRNLIESAAD
jgi:GH24 family phage-related lysozyme (muramidase)